MSLDTATFTSVMAAVAGPVAVVTTVDEHGKRWGFTASAFCSLSLDPPLVLVCLARTASCHGAFVTAKSFTLNVLAHDQDDLARHFARSGPDKFEGTRMTECERGLPGLVDAAARLVCSAHSVSDGGDHSILVGRVEEAVALDRVPLIYHNRAFTRPQAA
ncbi:flavin reductase family protein [Saccharothrix australiensis]|uniref:Flavin reductase (DIM6/NTAB) family NADH-FMN oxidoreductase RutF n=1 Tax=Saccharothrix australiensis TaxID=2072 RepID=A0A495VYN9_9PSEU|nr:flavin reductase family protein [Saccharothrix australiensis]RKT54541.1 flavin reductase (DIM6/NTAB) family NADH-FMN oxidoreductase RutF [Saccharothrix australiensis]